MRSRLADGAIGLSPEVPGVDANAVPKGRFLLYDVVRSSARRVVSCLSRLGRAAASHKSPGRSFVNVNGSQCARLGKDHA